MFKLVETTVSIHFLQITLSCSGSLENSASFQFLYPSTIQGEPLLTKPTVISGSLYVSRFYSLVGHFLTDQSPPEGYLHIFSAQ